MKGMFGILLLIFSADLADENLNILEKVFVCLLGGVGLFLIIKFGFK